MADSTFISAFTGEWAALSNFYVGEPLRFRGRAYASGEHMFQAFKAQTRGDHEMLAASASPAEARANGKHMLRLRPDWERVKYDVMRLVLAMKFCEPREERTILLATGDALLVEGSTWGDRVWGVDLKKGREAVGAHRTEVVDPAAWEPGEGWEAAPGRNWLGALLMVRRAELYAESRGVPKFSYLDVARFTMDVPGLRPTATNRP